MANVIQSAGSSSASASASKKATAKRVRRGEPARSPLCLSFCVRRGDGSPDWFAVPLEDYESGYRTGYLAFGEFMAALQADKPVNAFEIVRAAYACSNDDVCLKSSRRGAACGFLRGVATALYSVSRLTDHQEWTATRVAESDRGRIRLARMEAAEKAAFVARMKEGRARKAAERAQ